MKNYRASLINESGCMFDQITDSNIKRIRSWSLNRGGEYLLEILNTDGTVKDYYTVNNGRSYLKR